VASEVPGDRVMAAVAACAPAVQALLEVDHPVRRRRGDGGQRYSNGVHVVVEQGLGAAWVLPSTS